MNKTDSSTMEYYLIKFFSKAYTLQYDSTCDGQMGLDSELFYKEQCLSCMQENTIIYHNKKQKQKVILVPTQTIIHSCLYVVEVKYIHDINRTVWNRKHTKHDLQNNPIRLTDSDHDYTFEKFERRENMSTKEI